VRGFKAIINPKYLVGITFEGWTKDLIGTIAHEIMHCLAAIWRLEGKMGILTEKMDERMAEVFEISTILDEIGFLYWIAYWGERE